MAGAVRGVATSPARLIGATAHWFGRNTAWITRARRLAGENERLKRQVADLQGDLNRLTEAQIQSDRLRSDLGFFHTSPYKLIAADVIALRPDSKFDTMIVSCGSEQGVKVSSVVVTRDGLVGRVYEVEPGTAAVLMLTDQKSGVGARIQRPESRAVGLCEGDNTRTLSMIDLAGGADVKLGDAVVTSGLGGVYPPGLLIGSVCEVSTDVVSGGKTIRVQPHVGFDHLEAVYIIP